MKALVRGLKSGSILMAALVLLSVNRVQAQVPSFIDKIVNNPLLLLADRIIGSFDAKNLKLQGNVRLTTDDLAFFADEVEFRPDWARFQGRVTFQDKTESLFAQEIKVNRTKGSFFMKRALLSNGIQFFTAREIQQMPTGKTQASHLLLSPCPDCSHVGVAPWNIYARKATYEPSDQQIRLQNIQLSIFGRSILSVPYWQIANPSLSRFTGFLQPSIETSNAGGTALKLGYFKALDNRQDWTQFITLHTAGGVQLSSQYQFSDATRQLALTANLLALNASSSAQSKLREPDRILSDIEVKGDWFLNGSTRFKGQGRWESNDSFGAEFGHDTRLFRPTEVILERFKGSTYSALSLSRDTRSAEANARFPQSQIPLQMRARYEAQDQILRSIGKTNLQGSAALDFRLAERSDGRDSARLAARGVLRLPLQTWRGQKWQIGAFATAGLGKATELDTNSNDFAPDTPHFTGQSAFSTLGLYLDGRLPLAGNLGGGAPTRITPRLRLTHIVGDVQETTLANEDSLIPFLSAGTQFSPVQADPFDRGWLGTRLDLGLDWQTSTANGVSQVYIGQRFQAITPDDAPDFSGLQGDKSAALIQLTHTHQPTNMALTYLGRVPVSSGQSGVQKLNLDIPFARWRSRASYIQASNTPELEGGKQMGLTIQTPIWDAWHGTASFTQDLQEGQSTTLNLTASYQDCCLGIQLFYDYSDKTTNEAEQSIGFKVDLIGLSSIHQRTLLKF